VRFGYPENLPESTVQLNERKSLPPTSAGQRVAFCAVPYGLGLLLLINTKPLWLDEVIQLSAASSAAWQQLLHRVAANSGSAPLGYVPEWILISAFGPHVWAARLPSVLAGAGAMAVFVRLCGRFVSRTSTLALASALWIVCPLLLRYSLEARPYMQGVLFAMLAVLAQFHLAERTSLKWALLLGAFLVAAVYSQPFALFAPLGFAAWTVWQRRNRQYSLLTFAAFLVALVSFLPWYLWARPAWPTAIAHTHGSFHLAPSVFVALFRESVGDGYPAAISALALAAWGLWAFLSRARQDWTMALVAAVIAPVVLAFATDAQFNYFFAIRQVIYMVPFLLILMAEGATRLWDSGSLRAASALLLAVFLGASILKNYRHLSDRSEDWQRLSSALVQRARGGCILLVSKDELGLYTVFEPGISRSLCDSDLSRRVVMPMLPSSTPEEDRVAREILARKGMSRLSTERVGFANIEIFAR